ncbi:MAG TPA: hypothetical protein VK576_06120 [Thermoleophilia bacterium]|nr:hypothetical protein [Thermoleophilia bacterium]
MDVASIVGSPVWAVVAAVAAPICFALTFVLLSKDPGDKRGQRPEHPAYTGPRTEDDEFE